MFHYSLFWILEIVGSLREWWGWFWDESHDSQENITKGQKLGTWANWQSPFIFVQHWLWQKAEWLIKVSVLFILRSHNLKPTVACAITGVSPPCSSALQFLLWSFHQAISELWYFILFGNQSFNSGQVAVLGKGKKDASLCCCGLSLQVLIDKGTLYRWLKELTLYWDSVTSLSLSVHRWQVSPASELRFLQLQGLLWFPFIQIGPSHWTIPISGISSARPICPYLSRGAGSFVHYKLFLMFIDGLLFGKGWSTYFFP